MFDMGGGAQRVGAGESIAIPARPDAAGNSSGPRLSICGRQLHSLDYRHFAILTFEMRCAGLPHYQRTGSALGLAVAVSLHLRTSNVDIVVLPPGPQAASRSATKSSPQSLEIFQITTLGNLRHSLLLVGRVCFAPGRSLLQTTWPHAGTACTLQIAEQSATKAALRMEADSSKLCGKNRLPRN